MNIVLWTFLVVAGLFGAAYWAGRRNSAKALAAVPKVGENTPVPGGSIHSIEAGQGRPVVCIHGLGANLHSLQYALGPILAKEFRTILIDRPGCGYSERDSAELAPLSEQAKMVAAFLEAKGVEKPILVGHSLGGALSLQLALDFPDRIGGLVLLAPATMPIEEPPEIFKPLNIASSGFRNFLGNTMAGALAPFTAEKALKFVFAPETPPADFDIKGGAALGVRPEGFIVASEDLVAAKPSLEAMSARYGALKTPGVMVYGTADNVISADVHGAGFCANAPTIDYEELPGLGHMIPITAAETCAEAVRKVAAKTAATVDA